jgi:hypothetical protein
MHVQNSGFNSCSVCKLAKKGSLSIGSAPMRGGNHEDNLLVFVDFIKKPPGSDSIPPGFGMKIFEFFDIGSEMRLPAKLGVDVLAKLMDNFSLSGS